jgi:hypothetical protein
MTKYLLLILLALNLFGCGIETEKFSCQGFSKEMFSSQSINTDFQDCMFVYLITDKNTCNLNQIAETKHINWTFVIYKDNKISISNDVDIDENLLSQLLITKKDDNQINWKYSKEALTDTKDKQTNKITLIFNTINKNFNLRETQLLKFGEKPSYLNYKNNPVIDATYFNKEISGLCKKI